MCVDVEEARHEKWREETRRRLAAGRSAPDIEWIWFEKMHLGDLYYEWEPRRPMVHGDLYAGTEQEAAR